MAATAPGIALQIDKAARPDAGADGTTPRPFWPQWAGEGTWPVVLAWAAAATELLAAVLLVFGFLTRLAGLALAGTMVVAAWLTQIGPALQSGDTVLGFLPSYPAFGMEWTTPLFQLTLFCAGLGLFFAGGGALSLDRLGRRQDEDDAEDD